MRCADLAQGLTPNTYKILEFVKRQLIEKTNKQGFLFLLRSFKMTSEFQNPVKLQIPQHHMFNGKIYIPCRPPFRILHMILLNNDSLSLKIIS